MLDTAYRRLRTIALAGPRGRCSSIGSKPQRSQYPISHGGCVAGEAFSPDGIFGFESHLLTSWIMVLRGVSRW